MNMCKKTISVFRFLLILLMFNRDKNIIGVWKVYWDIEATLFWDLGEKFTYI